MPCDQRAPDWPRSRPAHRERGSALLLVPVAFLVLLFTAGLTVDYSAAFLAQREAASIAGAAANDAAAAAVDPVGYQRGQEIVLDPGVAERTVAASVAARGTPFLGSPSAVVAVAGNRVTVTVSGRVSTLFLRAAPWGGPRLDVHATASAEARQNRSRTP